MIIREKGALPSIALLCILALVTSCRKEEGTSPGVVMENHKPTQREMFKAEIERLVACSNMPMHEMMGAAGRLCGRICKTVDVREAELLLDEMCDMALKQPIDAPASYDEHYSFNWRQNYLWQLWYVSLCAFDCAQQHRQESFESWDRLFKFFRRYTDEIESVEKKLPPPDRFGWRWGTERGQYLRGIKGGLAQAVHVTRKFYFPGLVGGLSEEQKADILRRFDEVEKYAELPPDAPGKKNITTPKRKEPNQ